MSTNKKLDAKTAKRVLEEVKKRAQRRGALNPEELLFGPQREFVKSQKRLKAASCSRRAGKTYGLAYMLLDAGMRYPRSYPLYVTMAREEAKRILWPAMHEFNEKCQLGLQFKQNTGEVHLPNGSIILLSGAGSRREVEKGRGKKYPLVVIDEAQVFTKSLFEYMIDEVYEPATIDYLGSIIVTGTPNASCAGPFYEICHGDQPGWDVHNWTIVDNPYQPQPIEEELARIRERRGWDVNHPGYLREYRGLWIRDENDLVFHLDRQRNVVEELPAEEDMYVLGIDVGFNDPTAFVVLHYSSMTGKCTVVESYKEGDLTPSASAVHVERLNNTYNFASIVADSGGLGKGYVEEWKEKYGMNIKAAQKQNKAAYLEFLNGDLRTGALEIFKHSNTELLEEMQMLQWDPAKRQRGKFDFQRGYDDHLCDALLYGWRECRHQVLDNELNITRPEPGTKEYWQAEEARLLDAALNPASEGDWWEKL